MAASLVEGDNNDRFDVFVNQARLDGECRAFFRDTWGHTFEEDIACIAGAGTALGCNPLENDRFCPEEEVTRGQMAAFLVRGLDLPAAPDQGFTDIGDSVFRADIDALAAAGMVGLDLAFERIAPLLWMKAGSEGRRIRQQVGHVRPR